MTYIVVIRYLNSGKSEVKRHQTKAELDETIRIFAASQVRVHIEWFKETNTPEILHTTRIGNKELDYLKYVMIKGKK